MQELYTPPAISVGGQTADSEPIANILLVDDNPTKLLALESVLVSLGLRRLQAAEKDLRQLMLAQHKDHHT